MESVMSIKNIKCPKELANILHTNGGYIIHVDDKGPRIIERFGTGRTIRRLCKEEQIVFYDEQKRLKLASRSAMQGGTRSWGR